MTIFLKWTLLHFLRSWGWWGRCWCLGVSRQARHASGGEWGGVGSEQVFPQQQNAMRSLPNIGFGVARGEPGETWGGCGFRVPELLDGIWARFLVPKVPEILDCIGAGFWVPKVPKVREVLQDCTFRRVPGSDGCDVGDNTWADFLNSLEFFFRAKPPTYAILMGRFEGQHPNSTRSMCRSPPTTSESLRGYMWMIEPNMSFERNWEAPTMRCFCLGSNWTRNQIWFASCASDSCSAVSGNIRMIRNHEKPLRTIRPMSKESADG